jgi:hypothetical protein
MRIPLLKTALFAIVALASVIAIAADGQPARAAVSDSLLLQKMPANSAPTRSTNGGDPRTGQTREGDTNGTVKPNPDPAPPHEGLPTIPPSVFIPPYGNTPNAVPPGDTGIGPYTPPIAGTQNGLRLDVDRAEIVSDREREPISGSASGDRVTVIVDNAQIAVGGGGRFELSSAMPQPGSSRTVVVQARDAKGAYASKSVRLIRQPLPASGQPVPKAEIPVTPVTRARTATLCGPPIVSPSDKVMAIQRGLAAKGFDPGSADGKVGKRTCDAIQTAVKGATSSNEPWTWESLPGIVDKASPVRPQPVANTSAPPAPAVRPGNSNPVTPPPPLQPGIPPWLPTVLVLSMFFSAGALLLAILLILRGRRGTPKHEDQRATPVVHLRTHAGKVGIPRLATPFRLEIVLRADVANTGSQGIHLHRDAA